MTVRRPSGAGARSLVVGVATALVLVTSGSVTSVLLTTAISAVAAVGLGLVLGLADAPALSQGSFMLVGAYVYASTSSPTFGGMPTALAAVLAIAGGAIVAALASPLVRLRGFNFALATIALHLLIVQIARIGDWLPGGETGIFDIPTPSFAGLTPTSSVELTVLVAVVLTITVAVLHRRYRRGDIRRELAILACDEELLESQGGVGPGSQT